MRNARKWLREDIGQEFAGADLGDQRRKARLRTVARAAVRSPDAGFPQMVESDGELEAVYRLLGNDDVEAESILAPHSAATFRRAREAGLCLVVHDTTEFKFSGNAERDGLGFVTTRGQGFFGHFAMAVAPGAAPVPLGVCGFERFTRDIRKATVRKPHSFYTAKDPSRESLRWHRVLQAVEDQREGFDCVHIMDREGDMFDLMALALDLESRFVIRGDKERALADDSGLVADVLATIQQQTSRNARLSRRVVTRRQQTIRPSPTKKREPYSRRQRQRFVPREQRDAVLSVGATTVAFRRPRTAHSERKSIHVNIVYVWEASPPPGQEPIDWVLFTTEPIDTVAQLHTVVDYYRCRWLIEELFKALKTGCAFEKRQLESYHALSNALAIFSVVAWRLLLMRAVSRASPDAPSTSVLSTTQLQLLQRRLKLRKPLETAQEALFAVARLGGHLKSNGDPGWQSLGRGFEKLLLLQSGWTAAVDQMLGEDVIDD
jgi:hypothetical protein